MFYIYMMSNHNNIIISFTILNLYRIIFPNYVILKKFAYVLLIHSLSYGCLKIKNNKILSYRNHYFIIVV